jgi:hypothetical protein
MADDIPQYEFSADEAREMRSQISLERGLEKKPAWCSHRKSLGGTVSVIHSMANAAIAASRVACIPFAPIASRRVRRS